MYFPCFCRLSMGLNFTLFVFSRFEPGRPKSKIVGSPTDCRGLHSVIKCVRLFQNNHFLRGDYKLTDRRADQHSDISSGVHETKNISHILTRQNTEHRQTHKQTCRHLQVPPKRVTVHGRIDRHFTDKVL